MIYGQAKLPSAGLCNRLFTWARCKIFCHENGITMLEPSWTQLKWGHIFRNEKDKRTYHNLFVRDAHNIDGFKKKWIEISTTALNEPKQCTEKWASEEDGEKKIRVVFTGWKDLFSQLNGHHLWIRQEIERLAHPQWRRAVNDLPAFDIALHVRRGDFSLKAQTPISWFIDCLHLIKEQRKCAFRAMVFSDGCRDELEPLLTLKEVEFVETGSALSDLLAMSKAKLLLASGSSFSAWAAFLGQMPAITCPSHDLKWFNFENQNNNYVGEFDPNNPDPYVLNSIVNCLTLEK